MIDYRAGAWGFHVSCGWRGSLAPRALAVAVPNAVLTLLAAVMLQHYGPEDFGGDDFILQNEDTAYPSVATFNAAEAVIAAFSVVMLFILYNRSRTSYNRWWEGGTLLQKTRGEWFNAYSSIMAFTSTKPELAEEVAEYSHLVARLFSLLMCCGLQQVSPQRDRPFKIIELNGIEQESMDFLNSSPDKVEVILQWIQRSMVLQAQTGVLPVPPPILSRAFQEISRGIVNVQNARKIADFPYPFPLAQISMILQLVHWTVTPLASALAFPMPWAVLLAFVSIFVLWCIHFNALDLEFPFGARVNDLPMDEFQEEWNNSLITFLDARAQRPPAFDYLAERSNQLEIVMSDASEQYKPGVLPKFDKGTAVIRVETPLKAIDEYEPDPVNGLEHAETVAADAARFGAAINGEASAPMSRRTSRTSDRRPRRLSRQADEFCRTLEGRPPDGRTLAFESSEHWAPESSERWGPAKRDDFDITQSAPVNRSGFAGRGEVAGLHSAPVHRARYADDGEVLGVSQSALASSSIRQRPSRSTPVRPTPAPLARVPSASIAPPAAAVGATIDDVDIDVAGAGQ